MVSAAFLKGIVMKLVVGFLVVVVVVAAAAAAAAAAAVMRKLRIWDLREVPHDVNVGNVCAAIYECLLNRDPTFPSTTSVRKWVPRGIPDRGRDQGIFTFTKWNVVFTKM